MSASRSSVSPGGAGCSASASCSQVQTARSTSATLHGSPGIRPCTGSMPSTTHGPTSTVQRSRGAGTAAGSARRTAASVRYERCATGRSSSDAALTNTSVPSARPSVPAKPRVKPPPATSTLTTAAPASSATRSRTSSGSSVHAGRAAVRSYGGRSVTIPARSRPAGPGGPVRSSTPASSPPAPLGRAAVPAFPLVARPGPRRPHGRMKGPVVREQLDAACPPVLRTPPAAPCRAVPTRR